jgi:hypothetical protein
MSFSYKTLNSNDITLTSYIANKPWEVTNTTLSQNGVNIFIGENLPLSRTSLYDSKQDQKTSNQESRRLIYESIKHLYYENYTSGSLTGTFFNSSSYFNYEQSTLASGSGVSTFRNIPTITGSAFNPLNPSSYEGAIYDISSSLYDEITFDPDKGSKIVVISVDQEVMGSGLTPNTVYISGSGYYLRDDGEGNIYNYRSEANYARYNSAIYSQDIYLELINSNAPQLEYVGNIFYSHGLIVITNSDYLCVFGAPPTAINNYFTYFNLDSPQTFDILSDDYSDCGVLLPDSVITSPVNGYTFPDFTYNNGFLNITPNQLSVIPGEYQLGYTVNNSSGLISNTGSINLTITSKPLQITNIISSSTCWGTASNSPVTFSINYGVPYYSYSLDNGASYTGSNNLFNVTVSGSLISSDNNIIYVKDYLENIITQSFSSWYPGIVYTSSVYKNPCNSTGSDGKIIIELPENADPVSASLNNINYFGLTWYSPKIFTGLTTGSYTVYVKDSNNCVSSSTVILTPYTQLTSSVTQSNISCYGGSNGTLSVAFTNVIDSLYVNLLDPTSSYIYNNVPLSSFTNNTITAFGLFTGSYSLNVFSIGTNECQSYTNSFTLTSPTQITFTLTASYIDSCSNAMVFNATGGISPYNYYAQNTGSSQLFTSDSSSINLDGLNSGNYNLWVVDSNSCISTIQTATVYGRGYIYSGSNCETI